MKIEEFYAQVQTPERQDRLAEALCRLLTVDVSRLVQDPLALDRWSDWNMDCASQEAKSQSVTGPSEMAVSALG